MNNSYLHPQWTPTKGVSIASRYARNSAMHQCSGVVVRLFGEGLEGQPISTEDVAMRRRGLVLLRFDTNDSLGEEARLSGFFRTTAYMTMWRTETELI